MFNARSQEKEILDEANLDLDDLTKNLDEFKMINKYFGTKTCLINALNKIYIKYAKDFISRKISIADLGCGAGDLLIAIHEWAKVRNIQVELLGIDSNALICQHATKTTDSYSNIHIECLDVFSEAFLNQHHHYDIICLNNITHHFSDQELNALILKLKLKTHLAIIINDLHRHWIPYYFIKGFTKLFNFSTMARYDGPLSVLKGFTLKDFKSYLENSTIGKVDIRRTWAYRWQLIIWEKHDV